jgi:hypothetical protein
MQKNELPKATSCRSTAKSRLRSFHHGNLRQELIDAALAAPEIEGLSLRQLAASLGVTAAAAYRQRVDAEGEPDSYEYLPAALLGLNSQGVIPSTPSERDALFAWSAVHGAATLRSGRVPAALISIPELANEVAERVIRAMKHE